MTSYLVDSYWSSCQITCIHDVLFVSTSIWFVGFMFVGFMFVGLMFVGFMFVGFMFVGFMFYWCYVYIFTYTDVHISWSSCLLTVTRRVSLMEQQLLSLPDHMTSLPVFRGIRVARSLVFCVMFCKSLFVLFFWPLCCLSIDLQILITTYVIFKLFFRDLYRQFNI